MKLLLRQLPPRYLLERSADWTAEIRPPEGLWTCCHAADPKSIPSIQLSTHRMSLEIIVASNRAVRVFD